METLPNELLIKAASSLNRDSLCSSALTSKQMASIAQYHLWRNIRIPDRRQYEKDSEIAELTTALIKKPNLGNIIRNLEIHPEDRMITVKPSLLFPQEARLSHSVQSVVNECALVALILEQTPNLEVLELEVLAAAQSFRHKYDYRRYTDVTSPVQLIFGPQKDGTAEVCDMLSNPKD